MADIINQRSQESDINIIDYWNIIWKRKMLIGSIFFGFALFAFMCCLLSTKTYVSTISIISTESDTGSNVLTSLGATSSIAQQLTGIPISTLTPNQNILMGILKSWTIREAIVKQFNLVDYYYRKKIFNLIPFFRFLYIEDAVKNLEDVVEISMSEEGVISVLVQDKNPKMAADIANAYIEHLERIIIKQGSGFASSKKRFISEQLEKTEKKLKSSEEALREFKEKHNTIVLDEQAKGAIDATAYLKGEIMASEVQLQVMQSYTKDMHPDIIKLKEKIQELKRQLSQSQFGGGLDLPPIRKEPGHYQKEIYLPVANVPQVALDLARLMRDLKTQETIYILLTQQLEQAKIDEVKDTPHFEVLDKAFRPERKSKPKTAFAIVIAGFMGLVSGVITAFMLEYINKQRKKFLT